MTYHCTEVSYEEYLETLEEAAELYFTTRLNDCESYETRVTELENEGCTRSDAQSIADIEFDALMRYKNIFK